MQEYIKLLNLADEFDLSDLKKAYHKMVMQYHPDKAKTDELRAEYEEKMKKLNEAYSKLKKYLMCNGGKYTKPKFNSNSKFSSNSNYNSNYNSGFNSKTRSSSSYTSFDYEEMYKKAQAQAYFKNDEFWEAFFQDCCSADIEKEFKNAKSSIKSFEIFKKMFTRTFFNTLFFMLFRRPIIFFILLMLFCSSIYIPYMIKINRINSQTQEENKTDYDNQIDRAAYEKMQWDIFILDVTRKVQSSWNDIFLKEGFNKKENIKTVVSVTLSFNGTLINEPVIVRSSGEIEVDKACIRAIKQATFFRPLKRTSIPGTIIIKLVFDGKNVSHK